MIIGIDHILIAVDDLDLAIEVYERLGFQVLRGGKHPKMGTQNALVPLTDATYLELISIFDHALAEQASPFIVAALRQQNRLARFVVESNDLDADVAAIRARGFEIGDIHEGERERPDGQRVVWRSAMPADERFPFLIQDVTPREVRISAPTFGIGRTLHINDVNVGVIDVPTAQAEYEKLLGISGEDGWFELTRGAVILKDVNTERVLQIVLEADNPLEIVNAWQGGNVVYEQQVIGGMGITLQPFETLGAPLQITGRLS
ncbi:MAG: VOC family protein [Chloroflexota bacterium]|nr:MAG: VOC family protein [Chloroflexota bacterium]